MLGWAPACLLDSEFACRFISYSSDLVEVDRGVDGHHRHFILGQRACKAGGRGGRAAEPVAHHSRMSAPHTISQSLGHPSVGQRKQLQLLFDMSSTSVSS
jgi:hypothetical protein